MFYALAFHEFLEFKVLKQRTIVTRKNFRYSGIEDFSSFVEGAASSCCENIILGDLNLYLEKQVHTQK